MSTIINRATSCERDRQAEQLTDRELSNIAGGGRGAGTGKVTFNSFLITKHIDVATPKLF